jgi:acyl-CoA synthetase (AMP-forming)/AMP-acid ligase II
MFIRPMALGYIFLSVDFIYLIILLCHLDVYYGVLAARAIVTPMNIRLSSPEISYIIEHSGAKLILVDHEYLHLVKGTKVPIVVSNDTGRSGDPYEEFLMNGRLFSEEKGWLGLEVETNEDASAVLCYTYAVIRLPPSFVTSF